MKILAIGTFDMNTDYLPDLKWSLTLKKVSDLKEYPSNPRKLTDSQYQQIKESLEKFGIVERPVINLDGIIIGGHQRLRILKKLGLKLIECWIPSRILEEHEVNELNIRLNKNHASFDYDMLANHFEVEDLYTWGFELDQLTGAEDTTEEEKPKKTKKKECPNCGHEF